MSASPLGVAVVLENADMQAGMERQAHRLARGLAARGARVVLVTTYTPAGFFHDAEREPALLEPRDGYEIVRVLCRRWWSGEAVRALFARRLARELVTRSIDVVYGVQFQAALHVRRVAKVSDWPLVLKLACGGSYGDMAQAAGRKDAAEVLEHLRHVDRYACLSRQVESEVVAAGLPRERCVLVRNGVDRSIFAPEGAKAELPRGKTVLFIGRHDRQKRVDVLVRAFAKVAPTAPEARLVCAGKGSEEANLRALAAELGVAERVSFLGERKDVPALLRAASVFVLPSAAEGMPNALLEALSVGVPCVATAIPGTTDVATDEREALLVPPDDEAALARAIERLLVDGELAARLSRAGRERIAAEFDMERVADAHLALFESLRRPERAVDRSGLRALTRELAKTLVVGWFYALGRRLRPS
ncbi:MAG: glycosyltransferase family 4 protein [Planctomycetota bacterium]